MQEIELDGETYKNVNGNWVDSSCLIPPGIILRKLWAQSLSAIPGCTDAELETMVQRLRENGLWHESTIASKALLERYDKREDMQKLAGFLPVATACLRRDGRPEEAISVYREQRAKFGNAILSSPLLTSVAAACCDLGEWDYARRFAEAAYRRSAGKAGEELMAVFRRIDRGP